MLRRCVLQKPKVKSTPWGSSYQKAPEILHGYTSKVRCEAVGACCDVWWGAWIVHCFAPSKHFIICAELPARVRMIVGTAVDSAVCRTGCTPAILPLLRSNRHQQQHCVCIVVQVTGKNASERLDMRAATKADKFCK